MDKNYDILTYDKLIKKNMANLSINYKINDMRITDLIRDIKDNKKINNKRIQNILVKANLLTLYIGNNEILYKIKNTKVIDLYNYIDEVLKDLEELIKLLRFYSKEEIYLIGFYIDNEYYSELLNYLNVRIEDICNTYNINYIKQNSLFNAETNVNIYKKIKKSY